MMLLHNHGLWIQVHHSMLLLLSSVLRPFIHAAMDIYLGNNHAYSIECINHAYSIEGIGIVHLIVDGTSELVLHDVRYVPSIKKSILSVEQMDMHGYIPLLEKWS